MHRPWTRGEMRLLQVSPHWAWAAARLTHRTPHAVQIRWNRLHRPGQRRPGRQLDAEQRRVAEILTAVFWIAHRERVAVDASALIEALRYGRWRDIGAASLLTSPSRAQWGSPR